MQRLDIQYNECKRQDMMIGLPCQRLFMYIQGQDMLLVFANVFGNLYNNLYKNHVLSLVIIKEGIG